MKKKYLLATYNVAQIRLSGFKAIDAKLQIGPDLNYQTLYDAAELLKKLDEESNLLLARYNELSDKILEQNEIVKEFNARSLKGISSIYGSDGIEIEHMGGVRKSNIKPKGSSKKAKEIAKQKESQKIADEVAKSMNNKMP